MDKTLKLLLIEDNPLDAKLFQRLLDRSSRASYKISCAGSLAEGLKQLALHDDFDAVVIDLNLPDSEHLDTFRAVRLTYPSLPLIVLTADDDERLALQAVQAGAQDYIIKGELSPTFLGRAIRYAIERQASDTRIHQLNQDLEKRILDLAAANKDLDSLSHTLTLARDQAMQAAAYKSEFVAKMSHEIRTPIAAVIGTIDLIKTTPLNDEQRDLVEIINASAESLLNSVSDVLDYSKLESGQVELDIKDFSPVRLIEGTADLVCQAASKKGLSIMSFIDPYIPEMLQGDPVRIRQILLNLLGNAIKFTKRGEISVQATKESYDDLSMLVRFSVVDTGPGLSESELANLFQPFTLTSQHTSDEGPGLGLTISKRLVELMGGQMGVESDEGRGSTFWFSIRLKRSTNKRFLEALPLPTMASDLVGLRVLIADDTRNTRQIVQSYLKAARFHTSAAANSDEALEMLRHARLKDTPYDVAIIGLSKGADSLKLAAEIQEDPTISRTRLIYLTQQDQCVASDDLWKKGFSSYLGKPVRQASLIASIFDVMYGTLDNESYAAVDDESDEGKPETPKAGGRDKRTLKVLVVEDNKFLLQVMKRTLSHLGYTVDLARNGSEAVKKHQEEKYDLILMDCQMPIMNGYDATKRIREKESEDTSKHTPIIAMTASIQKSVRDQCLDSGMDDFLSKPVTIEQLQKVLTLIDRSAHKLGEEVAPDDDAGASR